MRQWKKISSKVVHANPFYSVRKDRVIKPNGDEGDYHIIVRRPAVFIVPLDEHDRVVLINVHRHTTQQFSIEIPAGGTDHEKPLTAAKRELKEETGVVAKKWTALGTFQVANGLSDEMGYAYLAQNLSFGKKNEEEMDKEGIAEILRVPFRRALRMIERGEITDGQTIVVLSLVALKLGILRAHQITPM